LKRLPEELTNHAKQHYSSGDR